MRKIAYIATLLILVLISCGTDSKHFELEGRLLNLNQGEFYVYSIDGNNIDGFDTIKVEAGRFSYKTQCTEPATMMIVFPNFWQLPVFMQPGKTVSIEGDASHLKELKVSGTKDNKLMTAFRERIASASPPQQKTFAEEFIKDNLQSYVSVFLVYNYFVATSEPNYKKASNLIALLMKEQPRNGFLVSLKQKIDVLKSAQKGSIIPQFSAKDLNGKTISNATIKSVPNAIITTWATWDYNKYNEFNVLKELKQKYGDKLNIITICVDASAKECKKAYDNMNLTWSVICDEQMFDSPIVKTFGLYSSADNIVIKNNRVVARNLNIEQLKNAIK